MTGFDQQEGRASLGDSIASLAGESLEQMQRGVLRAVLAGFEHLLRQQQWARDRLRAHAGQTLRLALDRTGAGRGQALEWRLGIDEQGFLQPADPQAEVAVSLLLRPSFDAVLEMFRDGPDAISRHMRVAGDPTLATTIADLARYLRWDPEEDLSRLVGDLAAHRLMGMARAGFAQFRDLRTRGAGAAAEYLAGEQAQLATRPLLGWLRDGTNELERRVAVLEARVARLRGGDR